MNFFAYSNFDLLLLHGSSRLLLLCHTHTGSELQVLHVWCSTMYLWITKCQAKYRVRADIASGILQKFGMLLQSPLYLLDIYLHIISTAAIDSTSKKRVHEFATCCLSRVYSRLLDPTASSPRCHYLLRKIVTSCHSLPWNIQSLNLHLINIRVWWRERVVSEFEVHS